MTFTFKLDSLKEATVKFTDRFGVNKMKRKKKGLRNMFQKKN